MGSLEVETADAARFMDVQREWRDLVSRACTPNVFMEPAVVAAAEIGLQTRTLLVWATDAGRQSRTLVGVWAFAIARAALLPFRMLRSPLNQHSFLGTPVLDRLHARDALVAMVEELASRRSLPGIVEARDLEAGAILDLLLETLSARKISWQVLAKRRRAKLDCGLDAAAYLSKTLSRSRQKRLASCRRRLEALGQFGQHLVQQREPVCAAFEQFLDLEGSGWKARWITRGRAFQRHPQWVAIARRMVDGLAQDGLVIIRTLTLDNRPIAMDVQLRSGNEAYTWKMAYDENFRAYGPGLLLLDACTRDLLANPLVTRTDSCNDGEIGIMTEFWSERRELADLLIGMRGRSPAFVCVVTVTRLRHRGRDLLRTARDRLRSAMTYRKWRARG